MMSGGHLVQKSVQDRWQPELSVFLSTTSRESRTLRLIAQKNHIARHTFANQRCLLHHRPAAVRLDMYKSTAVMHVLLDNHPLVLNSCKWLLGRITH